MIVKFIMLRLAENKHWSYLDIGAHHPKYLSNTAYFYKKGIRGINVEPDPQLIKRFYLSRKKDINLNIAVADKPGTMNFYLLSSPVLNTLSEREAHECEELGHKITGIIPVKTMTITEIITKYHNGIFPDFLSVDAEGYDLEILKTILWEESSPKIICVENIPYRKKLKNYFQSMQKNELTHYLEKKGYSIIAFTGINAIFVQDKYIEKS